MQSMLKSVLTRCEVEQLGFVNWENVKRYLESAFGEDGDPAGFRCLSIVAGWVTLSRRLGLSKAQPQQKFTRVMSKL